MMNKLPPSKSCFSLQVGLPSKIMYTYIINLSSFLNRKKFHILLIFPLRKVNKIWSILKKMLLFVIFTVFIDLKRPINLFAQHNAGQLMRESHGRHGKPLLCRRLHPGTQAIGTADKSRSPSSSKARSIWAGAGFSGKRLSGSSIIVNLHHAERRFAYSSQASRQ